jgi:putative zinc finger/helix-turn-helix YgiT family protein
MTDREEDVTVCSNCESVAKLKEGIYEFKESGLKHVTLKGINLISCDVCGNVDPIIPNVNDLMAALAWHIATQKYRLDGEEIRFLRKYLKMSAKEFARLIGVDNTTLSKWENDSDGIGQSSERLVRSMALALGEGLKERAEEGIKLFTSWIVEDYDPGGKMSVDMETLEVLSA